MRKSATLLAALAVGILLSTTGCGDQAAPDQIGLRYAKGPIDGFKFDGCVEPSTRSGTGVSDETVWLPDNLRYWKVAKTEDADSKNVLTVVAASGDPAGAGVQVDVAYQATMRLNTNCDDKTGGVLRQFWESIGRRMNAASESGWKDMMGVTVETALTNSAKTELRRFTDVVLVAGTKQAEIQTAIGPAFNTELARLAGGPFFCGPSFRRGQDACPPVEISIIGITYTNPAVQDAADKRAAAVQNAAALLAEAQGKLDAANKTGNLYNNPAWVRLQEAQMRLDQVKACAANSNCTIIIGDSGSPVIVNGGK